MVEKLLILTIVTTIFILNSSRGDDSRTNNFILNSAIEFRILTPDGDDLLNSETSGHFSLQDMQLYYLINGEKTKVQDLDPQIGGNNGIMLITEGATYSLRCFTYSNRDEWLTHEKDGVKTGRSVAYLELNGEVTDTIKTEWESKENKYFVIKKVWYNNELHEPAEEIFSVIKSN